MSKMSIETYEIEEAEFAGDDIDTAKYQEYHEKLGLEGQSKILTNDNGAGIPFQKMSNAIFNTWSAYCPNKSNLKTYRETLIPLRVLKLISICQERGYFKQIYIWSESHDNPDPVVIGCTDQYDWNINANTTYLIARWGESLKSWPEIVKIAKEKTMARFTGELKEKIANANMALANVEHLVNKYLSGERVDI